MSCTKKILCFRCINHLLYVFFVQNIYDYDFFVQNTYDIFPLYKTFTICFICTEHFRYVFLAQNI